MDRRVWLLQWIPVWTRLVGLGGVIFVIAFWALTNRFEPGLLGFLGLMLGIGEGVDALRELTLGRIPPPAAPPVPPVPPAPEPEHEG